jgi:hypothetical protein
MGVLGNLQDAVRCFGRAAELSHRFGFGRYVIEADRQIEAMGQAGAGVTDRLVADAQISVLPPGLAAANQRSFVPRRMLR